jgi:hypothetical protein
MRSSSKELTKDPNQRGAEIARTSAEEPVADKDSVRAYLANIGRKGGLKDGRARADKLTAQKRSDIARDAAKSRWAKLQADV